MNKPYVLISILNWNNSDDTIECIDSILLQKWANTEVVLIDNNSTNDSLAKIKYKFPGLHIISLKDNYGYAGGHKYAVEYAKRKNFDALWILNNDVVVEKNSFRALIEAYILDNESILGSIILFEESSKIEFGGGREILANGSVNMDVKDNQYENLDWKEAENRIKKRKVSYVHGASIFIPLKVIEDYGFIDTDFFLYCEEMDYCYKLRLQGINSVIVPQSRVFHKGRKSTKLNDKLNWVAEYYLYRNFQYFYSDHEGKTKEEILNEYGGFKGFYIRILKGFLWKLVIFYITQSYKKKSIDFNKIRYYYRLLGVFHFLKGKKGKTIKPEKFLNLN